MNEARRKGKQQRTGDAHDGGLRMFMKDVEGLKKQEKFSCKQDISDHDNCDNNDDKNDIKLLLLTSATATISLPTNITTTTISLPTNTTTVTSSSGIFRVIPISKVDRGEYHNMERLPILKATSEIKMGSKNDGNKEESPQIKPISLDLRIQLNNTPLEKQSTQDVRLLIPMKQVYIDNTSTNIASIASNFQTTLTTSQRPYSDIPYVDTHCHLDLISRFHFQLKSLNDLIEKFDFPHNFAGCVTVFCYPNDWHQYFFDNFMKPVLSDNKVWGTIGCHPKEAEFFSDEKLDWMRALILKEKKIVAIGEMGLDYSKEYFYERRFIQQEVFKKQLDLAKSFQMPLVIHCRDAEEDAVDILTQSGHQNSKIHRHCFTEGWNEAKEWLNRFPNCYIGITCSITTPGKYPRLVEAVKNIPLDRIVLETDAPYFVPKSMNSKKVRFSNPSMALEAAYSISVIKNIPLDEILMAVWKNSTNLYEISP